MPNIWVGNPAGGPTEAAEMARLEAEMVSMEALNDKDACRICGRREDLTEEHTPSKKAGNPTGAVHVSIDYERSVQVGQLQGTAERLRGSVTSRSLCGRCNNDTGRWYNPAYIRLVEHCRPYAIPENAGRPCDI